MTNIERNSAKMQWSNGALTRDLQRFQYHFHFPPNTETKKMTFLRFFFLKQVV